MAGTESPVKKKRGRPPGTAQPPGHLPGRSRIEQECPPPPHTADVQLPALRTPTSPEKLFEDEENPELFYDATEKHSPPGSVFNQPAIFDTVRCPLCRHPLVPVVGDREPRFECLCSGGLP